MNLGYIILWLATRLLLVVVFIFNSLLCVFGKSCPGIKLQRKAGVLPVRRLLTRQESKRLFLLLLKNFD
jgi:hypothetical protein